ncbi:aminoglycoside phosphotransferase family protein [Dactylosporangium sp. NPDC051485]|uniref:phosphotransferase family protein n=1 Tax=Dactylosporangium sp. NPDC051485 TaxID=3154846 RepID=UPI00341A883C
MIDAIEEALREACPGLRIDAIRRLDAGYTSRQWVADTDEGPLLAKTPVRDKDPEHLRGLIATTRRAAEGGVPVVRYRAFAPYSAPLDGPLIVQEYQHGVPADAAWESMSPPERLAFAAELGELVGRVHSCTGEWFGDVLGRTRHADAATSLHALIDSRLAKAPHDLIGAGNERRAQAPHDQTGTGNERPTQAPHDPAGTGSEPRAGAPHDLAGAGNERLAAALHRAVDRLAHDDPPVLTHGDLWRPNLIMRDGRIACLLDFEHGRYADRFLDFGKLDEHIFTAFPEGREPFLTAYAARCPLPDDWPERVRLAHLLHALSMAVYFLRWSPHLAPEYVDILDAWLAS